MFVFLLCALLGLWLWPVAPAASPADMGTASPPLPPAPECRFPYFRPPPRVSLGGEPAPLQDPAVREDLDREFTIVVWSRAQTLMWLKRAHRYFPPVERKLKAQHLPLDLKYVLLVESDLRLKARSPAGALGPWQFIQSTAQRFQLKTNEAIDERLDFGAATDAALQYLKVLHQTFNNWPLALAAYNCGEGRVQKAIATQGVANFYYLSLPEETERYVHRILAAKIVLEDPVRYGYDLPPEDLYPPLTYDETMLVLSQPTPLRTLAEVCGTYYKTMKSLNPWIKGDTLPTGAYRLLVPQGAAPRLQVWAAAARPAK